MVVKLWNKFYCTYLRIYTYRKRWIFHGSFYITSCPPKKKLSHQSTFLRPNISTKSPFISLQRFFFLTLPRDFLAKKISLTLDCRETMGNGKGGSTLQGGFQCLGMDIGSGKNSILCWRLRPWDFYIPPWKNFEDFEPKNWRFGWKIIFFWKIGDDFSGSSRWFSGGALERCGVAFFGISFLLNKSGPGISFAKKGERLKSPIQQKEMTTPLKINMEHNHGGLVQIIFLSFYEWFVGSMLIFQGLPG